jgi:hypothetical protein
MHVFVSNVIYIIIIAYILIIIIFGIYSNIRMCFKNNKTENLHSA